MISPIIRNHMLLELQHQVRNEVSGHPVYGRATEQALEDAGIKVGTLREALGPERFTEVRRETYAWLNHLAGCLIGEEITHA